jgi:asparagine synthase (glutamine-hydrolysing)
MPGLAGFTLDTDAARADAQATLVRMRALLAHGESHHADELFCDGRVCATRTHTGIIQHRPQPHTSGGVRVWLDGEFYNREELSRSLESDEEPASDAALLAALYQRDGDGDFLKEVDGVFAAVVYDEPRRLVHLVSDRYGLRHLYWTRHAGGVAWASEVKAMLGLQGFEPEVDPAALEDFFETGNLTGDRSWLEGVGLLPAATVLTWKLDGRTSQTRRYWGRESVKPLEGEPNAVELADELGRLFRDAVERRSRAGERTGLTLSGGLDSRAILAAMPEREETLHAVTFGKRDCEDARVAALAAAAKGAAHHVCEMGAKNWLNQRLEAVWWTDGELNLMHMHVAAVLPRVRSLFDITLDGLGANGVVGDSWMEHGLSGPFEYVDGRTRRFLVLGPTTVRGFVEGRFPFLDNRFVELALAVPDHLKEGNALYRMMLLRTFPEFFESIPWQKTGAPITWPRPNEGRRKSLAEVGEQLRYKLSWFGVAAAPARGYADYASWIRQEPARSVFIKLLKGRDALYPEYLLRERVEGDLEKHLGGRDRSEFLCRALTFEVWLRQLFLGEYRGARDESAELVGAL